MPGWPLPTFSTASAASTRAVSTARSIDLVPTQFRHRTAFLGRGHVPSAALTAERRRGVGARARVFFQHTKRHAPPAMPDCVTAGVRTPLATAVVPSRRGDVLLTWRRCPIVRPARRRRIRCIDLGRISADDCGGDGHHDDGRAGIARTARAPLLGRTIRAYVALTKPRVLELLLVTTVPVMILAEGGFPNLWLVLATVIGGSMSAGSAAAFNMYLDRDIDAHMQRTVNRPLVTGEVSPRGALVFAWTLAVASTVWLGWSLSMPRRLC